MGITSPPFVPDTLTTDRARRRRRAPDQPNGPLMAARGYRSEDHRLPRCPRCGGSLQRGPEAQYQVTEDLSETLTPTLTVHTTPEDYCPQCLLRVCAAVPDALPGSPLGHRLLLHAAWRHYGQGEPLAEMVASLNRSLYRPATPGELLALWQRVQAVLFPWYEQIQAEALESGVLDGDQSGRRPHPRGPWLWAFTSEQATWYVLDTGGAGPALRRWFQAAFHGRRLGEFSASYQALAGTWCPARVVQVLRDVLAVDDAGRSTYAWLGFLEHVEQWLGQALAGWPVLSGSPVESAEFRERLVRQWQELLAVEWSDSQARRLARRWRKFGEKVLQPRQEAAAVARDQPLTERALRPARRLQPRGTGYRKGRGADVHAVLRSIHETLGQRGHEFLATTVAALTAWSQTGNLPELPKKRPA